VSEPSDPPPVPPSDPSPVLRSDPSPVPPSAIPAAGPSVDGSSDTASAGTAIRSRWRDPVLVIAGAVLGAVALTALVLTAISRPEIVVVESWPDEIGTPPTVSAPAPADPGASAGPHASAGSGAPFTSGASPAPGGAVILPNPPRPSAGAQAPPWSSLPEPATTSACPASGVLIRAGGGNAAMGLRVHGLELLNCGTRPYPVRGYPAVQILDADRQPLDLDVFNGKSVITMLDSIDAPAEAITLKPGESAWATIAWRTTARDGIFIEAAPLPGRPSQTVDPGQMIDLGDGGRLGVGPWRRAATG
jgi:hypothetical protein